MQHIPEWLLSVIGALLFWGLKNVVGYLKEIRDTLRTFSEKFIIHEQQLQHHESRLNDHETRLRGIENKH